MTDRKMLVAMNAEHFVALGREMGHEGCEEECSCQLRGLFLAVKRLRDVIAEKLKFGSAPTTTELMDLADTLEREGRGR